MGFLGWGQTGRGLRRCSLRPAAGVDGTVVIDGLEQCFVILGLGTDHTCGSTRLFLSEVWGSVFESVGRVRSEIVDA
jgi:hypothetical protein